MSKLNYRDKVNLYNDRQHGMSISSLSNKYKIQEKGIKYITRLIDKHGMDILLKKQIKYTKEFKQEAIDRVLINEESILLVAIDIGLPTDSLLRKWISNYKENNYNVVEQKRGRSSTIMKKVDKVKKTETIEEEVERLKKENDYLKAELEYSKKLRAVVQARKNQQQKRK